MSRKSLNLTEDLYDYLLDSSLREDPMAAQLRAETADLAESNMQIAPEQGQFMALLVRMLNARRTLDIGVFTGYSSLVVAQALPADGQVVALDVSEEWTAIGKRYWAKAGVAGKIDLRLAPALVSLDALLEDGQAGSFDFAFIDADKENYAQYYERALELIRPGGVIAVDNVLWGGAVVDSNDTDADTLAIRAFNENLKDDERVALSLLPIADGLTLALKKE